MTPDDSLAKRTPWEFAKQLLAQGFTRELVAERLVAEHGLSHEDARLLLADGPVASSQDPEEEFSSASGFNLGPPLGIALALAGLAFLATTVPYLMILGSLMFGLGIVRAFASFGASPSPAPVDASRLVKLPPESTAQRCARHPDLASIGICARCRSFACWSCAPFAKFASGSVCLSCDTLPAEKLARIEKARNASSIGCVLLAFAWAALWGFEALNAKDWWPLSGALACAAPLALLGVLQRFIGSIWPTLVALALSIVMIVPTAVTLGRGAAVGLGCLFGPVWLVLNSTLFTLASNHRGRNRALSQPVVGGSA